MAKERQSSRAEMPDSMPEGSGRNPREHGVGVSSAGVKKEESRPEDERLMEEVVESKNLIKAYRKVVRNGGAAGVDEMTVEELKPHLQKEWPKIKEALLADEYKPQPVRRVEIPKPGGKGVRLLGIPTVVDRLIQQAVLQVLDPIFDPGFSESSFGFRVGRSAHQAVLKAREYVASGKRWMVDLDLEKFFDRVNHDVLMSRVARKVRDKRVLHLLRRYLQAGIMDGMGHQLLACTRFPQEQYIGIALGGILPQGDGLFHGGALAQDIFKLIPGRGADHTIYQSFDSSHLFNGKCLAHVICLLVGYQFHRNIVPAAFITLSKRHFFPNIGIF